MMLASFLLLVAAAAAPVSFYRDVAPILAMHCHGCHGEAGGLSTRTHSSLLSGGNLGRAIIPGNSDQSLLVQFIEGRRGRSRRMPQAATPLPPESIAAIRRWIDEGARADDPPPPPDRVFSATRTLPPGAILRVTARAPASAYLELSVRAAATRRLLYERSGAIKPDPRDYDAGQPGDLIRWDVRPGRGWPSELLVEMTLRYSTGPAATAELDAVVALPQPE